jgi:hypothetical protein
VTGSAIDVADSGPPRRRFQQRRPETGVSVDFPCNPRHFGSGDLSDMSVRREERASVCVASHLPCSRVRLAAARRPTRQGSSDLHLRRSSCFRCCRDPCRTGLPSDAVPSPDRTQIVAGCMPMSRRNNARGQSGFGVSPQALHASIGSTFTGFDVSSSVHRNSHVLLDRAKAPTIPRIRPSIHHHRCLSAPQRIGQGLAAADEAQRHRVEAIA